MAKFVIECGPVKRKGGKRKAKKRKASKRKGGKRKAARKGGKRKAKRKSSKRKTKRKSGKRKASKRRKSRRIAPRRAYRIRRKRSMSTKVSNVTCITTKVKGKCRRICFTTPKGNPNNPKTKRYLLSNTPAKSCSKRTIPVVLRGLYG